MCIVRKMWIYLRYTIKGTDEYILNRPLHPTAQDFGKLDINIYTFSLKCDIGLSRMHVKMRACN